MNTEFKTTILKNGLTVMSLKNCHLHSVNIGIYVHKLPESICGIAHLTEHMFFRRLGNISQRQLYFETDRIGATLRAVTYADFICFDIIVSPTKVKDAFNIISKVFDDFLWTPAEVAAEKKVVRRQIEEKYNSVYSKADAAYYDGTPKGVPIMGRISDVNKMSAKLVNEYHKKVFVPNNCCVVLTGNFDNDDLRYCEKFLGNLPQNAKTENNNLSDYHIKEFANRSCESDKIYNSDYEFSDVIISFDVDTKKVNRYAAEILHSIIGFGVTSKLSQELRERYGFVSEVDGDIEFSGNTGRMTFEFEVKNTNLNQSLKSAFGVISRAKGALKCEDLETSILFYSENQYRLLDDSRELNFLIGYRSFATDEGLCSIDELSERYAICTIDDINRAAYEIFTPNNLIITVSNSKKHKKSEIVDTFKKIRKEL